MPAAIEHEPVDAVTKPEAVWEGEEASPTCRQDTAYFLERGIQVGDMFRRVVAYHEVERSRTERNLTRRRADQTLSAPGVCV